GADSLVVNDFGGPILTPITYDGGTGVDSLTIAGGTASSDLYAPGPVLGSGSSTINFTSGGGGVQNITFVNVEPVFDDVAGPLTVRGTNADNSINYRQGAAGNRGLVSVDDQDAIDFINKTALTIDALAGADAVTLNTPLPPAGLGSITVLGGDPTGDSLTVIGRPGQIDAIVATTTAQGAGIVQNFWAPGVPQVFY